MGRYLPGGIVPDRQPPRYSLVRVFCGTGAVIIIFLLSHVQMRHPNPNCNRLLSPNRNDRTAHVVSDDIDALDIGNGVNLGSYCGTSLPASHRALPLPPTRDTSSTSPPLTPARATSPVSMNASIESLERKY